MTRDLQSPSQTSGPLFGFALMFEGCDEAVAPGQPGSGADRGASSSTAPAGRSRWPECFLEVWEGEQWARARTDEDGRYRVVGPQARAGRAMPDGTRRRRRTSTSRCSRAACSSRR